MVQHTSCACHQHRLTCMFRRRLDQTAFGFICVAKHAQLACLILTLNTSVFHNDHIHYIRNCSFWERLFGNSFLENCVRNRCIRRRDLYRSNNLDLFVSVLVKLIEINFVATVSFRNGHHHHLSFQPSLFLVGLIAKLRCRTLTHLL